jgi:hypothetical protein
VCGCGGTRVARRLCLGEVWRGPHPLRFPLATHNKDAQGAQVDNARIPESLFKPNGNVSMVGGVSDSGVGYRVEGGWG